MSILAARFILQGKQTVPISFHVNYRTRLWPAKTASPVCSLVAHRYAFDYAPQTIRLLFARRRVAVPICLKRCATALE